MDEAKKTSAGETAEANGAYDGGDVNRRQHNSANGNRSKATCSAELLFECGGKNLLDAGLRAAKRGWKIFPCNGKKEPLTSHGFKDATTDEAIIRAWAKNWPGALWGRALEASVLVIDLDMKHGNNGIREFEKLQSCKPEEFDAPRVATATGGIHIYTNATDRDFKNTIGKIAFGVDTRTNGGYVIIPSGDGSYRWLTDPETPKPPSPQWAEAALRRITNLETMAEAKSFQGASQFGNAILASACNAIKTAPGGTQEATLNDRSFQVGRYIGGGLLEHEPAIESLIAAGLLMVNTKPKEWTEKEVRFKVTRAVEAGMGQPSDGEESFRFMDEVHRKYLENPKLHEAVEEWLLQEAQRKAEQSEQEEQEGLPEKAKVEPEQERSPQEQQEQPKQSDEPWLKPGEQLLIRRMGKGTPPPVAFLVDGLLHEVGTGMIVSKYLGGKTFVAMALAASVASGQAFAGREVLRKGGVLWFAAEGEREVDKRIRAAVKALGCDPDEQPIYVQIASVPKLLSQGGEASVMQIVRQAEQTARTEFRVPLVLVVFDTMIKSAGYRKSENDAVEVNNTIQVMENISIRTKCFVLALDHMGKNEGLGARGSSDKPSSMDVYVELKPNARKKARVLHAIKVKGEKADEQIDFEIVGTELEDGQKTGLVRWGKWCDAEPEHEAGRPLNKNATLLLQCVEDAIMGKGQQLKLFYNEPAILCVRKIQIREEFYQRYEGTNNAKQMAFTRAWNELVAGNFITITKDGNDEWQAHVFLEGE
jgi:AAA domain/Bifunctional DNA primase/polymerase, N-terminal